MTSVGKMLFNFSDHVQMASMNLRKIRDQVISSNIANAETPGFRALGYGFEQQLQDVAELNKPLALQVTNGRHLRNSFTQADGTIRPEVFIRPTESIPEDGNTVDMDHEMGQLAQNHILFRTAVEVLNRKVGMLKYAINGGR